MSPPTIVPTAMPPFAPADRPPEPDPATLVVEIGLEVEAGLLDTVLLLLALEEIIVLDVAANVIPVLMGVEDVKSESLHRMEMPYALNPFPETAEHEVVL